MLALTNWRSRDCESNKTGRSIVGRPASSADRDGESLKRRIEELERQLADSQDQAQRQEDRLDLYQALIDNAPFDICFKDLNGTYLLTNRAFDTNLQKSKDAIIGKTLTQLIGPES